MTRRNFFGWGAGTVALLASFQLLFRKDRKKKMTKMLTRDGRLVEIDISHLQSNVRMASKKEIQTWVWSETGTAGKPLK